MGWGARKGEGHMQGERTHRTRDGATRTITVVPPCVHNGHVSKVGRNPGRGAVREWKGGCTKAGVRKGDGAPPRACNGEGV